MRGVVAFLAVLLFTIPMFIILFFGGDDCNMTTTSNEDSVQPQKVEGLLPDAVGAGPDKIPSEAVEWITITSTSGKYKYPPAFIAANMMMESSFNPNNFTGDRNGGTIGLLQINQSEWNRIYGSKSWDEDRDNNGTRDIEDPKTHSKYAAQLYDENTDNIKEYRDSTSGEAINEVSDLVLLLAAHNAGFTGGVKRWPNIPGLTRDTYIPKITKYAERWGGIDIHKINVEGGGNGNNDNSSDTQAYGCTPGSPNIDIPKGKKKPGPWGGFSNGKIPLDALEPVPWAKGHHLRADALEAFVQLNNAYREKFGRDISLTDSFRDYDTQVLLKERKGGKAATPGKSNHGWALAVDLGDGVDDYGTPTYNWMLENAPRFGWINPDWAQQGGSNEEPWHWEFWGIE